MKVGDLVWIAKPSLCCGSMRKIGRIFTISSFDDGVWKCIGCGNFSHGMRVMGDSDVGINPSRLRVIPPFPELIDELIADEVTV